MNRIIKFGTRLMDTKKEWYFDNLTKRCVEKQFDCLVVVKDGKKYKSEKYGDWLILSTPHGRYERTTGIVENLPPSYKVPMFVGFNLFSPNHP